MPRTRPAYPPEFRAQIVALAQAAQSVEELALSSSRVVTIRGWIRVAIALVATTLVLQLKG